MKAEMADSWKTVWKVDPLPFSVPLRLELLLADAEALLDDVLVLLVVDDDRALLRALRVGLSARGNDVIVGATGEEGLSKAALEHPELVIVDLGLPDLDGLEVCRRIRQWSDVPVIVLSATGIEDRKVAALDLGADDYVTKPFSMRELEARVRVGLRHHDGGADGGAS